MNIGIDIRESINPTGVGKYIRELVSGLQQEKRIKLFLYADFEKDKSTVKLRDNDKLVISIDKRAWLWEQYWLPNKLSENKVDLFHATNNKGLPWCFRGKKVITIHDIIPYYYPEVLTPLKHRLRFVITQKIDARIADIIFTDSLASKKDIIAKLFIPGKKIKVIWPFSGQGLSKKEKHAIRYMPQIPKKYIIHIGGIDPRKNIPFLMRAFKQFQYSKNENKTTKLIITGKSTSRYANKMVELSKEYGLEEAVIFTGELNRRDLEYLLENADIMVYPSLYEGFGLPIIEAMEKGIPIITSNVSSMPEVAGVAARLINPYNEKEMSNALNDIINRNELKKYMIEIGNKRIEYLKEYNMIEYVIKEYLRLKS